MRPLSQVSRPAILDIMLSVSMPSNICIAFYVAGKPLDIGLIVLPFYPRHIKLGIGQLRQILIDISDS